MYEEGNKKINLNWISLAIKLALLALFVFILVWIFSKNGNNKSNIIAENSTSYVNNIGVMKTAAIEYFTDNKLPTKVGETEKLSLSQMVNQKLLIDFTDDGKSCDLTNSYVQTTKTADENYALKISLNCDKKSDFIVTTIAKKCAVAGNTCKEEEKNETIVDKTPNNNTGNNNNNNNNNNNTGNNNSSNNTGNVNSSNNSGYKPGPSTSNNVSTTVRTTIKITVTCQSCNTTIPTPKPDPTPVPKPDPVPTKTLYYKYVKYGQWIEGYKNGSEYENKCSDTTYYDYCKERTNTYSTTTFINSNKKTNSQYSYTLKLDNISNNNTKENTVEYLNKHYFSSSRNDYSKYFNNEDNDITMVGTNQNCVVYPSSAYEFKKSSLDKDNFNFNVSEVYKRGNGYYVDITVYYNKRQGVNPYYAENLGHNVYFVPLKFDVKYSSNSDCIKDTKANKWKYSGYSISNPQYESGCSHREISYKWSTSTSLDGYTYTGISEYR